MKALVLARGLARRMREDDPRAALGDAQARAAAAGQKAMMPVGGDCESARPFLDYVLASLADAGCRDIGIVIGPEHDEVRRRYTNEAPVTRAALSYVIQPEAHGTAHAVLCAASWAERDPFLVVNGDNLYAPEVLRSLVQLSEPGLPAFTQRALLAASNIPAERIASFALIAVDDQGYLTGIVEKPGPDAMAAAGDDALVSMNCWRFDTRIFEACRMVRPSARGELELPGAVAVAVTQGVRFATVPGTGSVLDLSRRSDVAEVSRRLRAIVPRL